MQTQIETDSGGLWSGRFLSAHAYACVPGVTNPGSDCENKDAEAPTRTPGGRGDHWSGRRRPHRCCASSTRSPPQQEWAFGPRTEVPGVLSPGPPAPSSTLPGVWLSGDGAASNSISLRPGRRRPAARVRAEAGGGQVKRNQFALRLYQQEA